MSAKPACAYHWQFQIYFVRLELLTVILQGELLEEGTSLWRESVCNFWKAYSFKYCSSLKL